ALDRGRADYERDAPGEPRVGPVHQHELREVVAADPVGGNVEYIGHLPARVDLAGNRVGRRGLGLCETALAARAARQAQQAAAAGHAADSTRTAAAAAVHA